MKPKNNERTASWMYKRSLVWLPAWPSPSPPTSRNTGNWPSSTPQRRTAGTMKNEMNKKLFVFQ